MIWSLRSWMTTRMPKTQARTMAQTGEDVIPESLRMVIQELTEVEAIQQTG
jgi:hypothetical protein